MSGNAVTGPGILGLPTYLIILTFFFIDPFCLATWPQGERRVQVQVQETLVRLRVGLPSYL